MLTNYSPVHVESDLQKNNHPQVKMRKQGKDIINCTLQDKWIACFEKQGRLETNCPAKYNIISLVKFLFNLQKLNKTDKMKHTVHLLRDKLIPLIV